MSFLRRAIDGLKVSPYPLSYTLAYRWFARHPSFRNHTGMALAPLSAPAGSEPLERVILFGDLPGMPTPATVDDALKAVFARGGLIAGNLEGPLRSATAGASTWARTVDPGYFSGVLAAAGIAPSKLVVSVANNHSQDAGGDGLLQTVDTLAALGVEAVGQVVDGVPATSCRTLDSGLRVGTMAWTHWLNSPPDQRFDDPARLGVLRADDAVEASAELARSFPSGEAYADTRIALCHWEFEYQHFPRAATRSRARELAGAGCDIVSGAHPHVMQPLEVIDDCHVLYSQGSWAGTSQLLGCRIGVLFEVELHAAGERRGRVAGYRLHPYLYDLDRNHLRLVTLDDEEARALLERVHDVTGEPRL